MLPVTPEMLVAPTWASIIAAVKAIQLTIKFRNVPQSAKTFIRLIEQVERDLQHALDCRIHGGEIIRNYPDFYQKWASSAIDATLGALKDLERLITRDVQTDYMARLEYLLSDYDKLVDQERSLRYVHSTLLSAINAMHLMIFQAGPTAALSPGALSPRAPSASPRRASSQRPVSMRSRSSREQYNVHATSPGLLEGDLTGSPFDSSEAVNQPIDAANLKTGKRIEGIESGPQANAESFVKAENQPFTASGKQGKQASG